MTDGLAEVTNRLTEVMSKYDAPTAGSRFIGKIDPDAEGPAMQIDGLPDSIDWQPVADFLTSLGLDLNEIPAGDADSGGITIGWHGIRCTVYAKNADGKRHLDLSTGQVAKHHVYIPVVHEQR